MPEKMIETTVEETVKTTAKIDPLTGLVIGFAVVGVGAVAKLAYNGVKKVTSKIKDKKAAEADFEDEFEDDFCEEDNLK